MAISKVRVKVNGTWTNLTLDSSTGKWTGTITAPSTTSYNLTNGYYPVAVEATNDAGTVVTKEATDATIGASLRLTVKEKIKPVVTLVTPSNGAYITNNKQPITFKVTDEVGGSGVALSTVKLKIDSTTYTSSSTGMEVTSISNGYQFVYTPQTALTDGSHTITVNASDNDGNAATAVSATFKVDTVPPTLTVSSPKANLITNKSALTVVGITNDATSSPVTVALSLNGTDQGSITVADDGAFSKDVTLTEGSNTIIVEATDAAGRTSDLTFTVKLDTSVPAIKSVVLSPNPADTSAPVAITIEVS